MARKSTIDAILAVLPESKFEISRKTGICRKTIMKVVDYLHSSKQVHIASWRPHPVKGPRMPVYAAGEGLDMPCFLATLTKQEVYQRFRARHKGKESGDRMKAKDRSKYWKAKAAAQGDPLVNALFGCSTAPEERS